VWAGFAVEALHALTFEEVDGALALFTRSHGETHDGQSQPRVLALSACGYPVLPCIEAAGVGRAARGTQQPLGESAPDVPCHSRHHELRGDAAALPGRAHKELPEVDGAGRRRSGSAIVKGESAT
jgi:hypothetical protein